MSTKFVWPSQRDGSQRASSRAWSLWYKIQSWKTVWSGEKWEKKLSGSNQPVDQNQIWAAVKLHFFFFLFLVIIRFGYVA